MSATTNLALLSKKQVQGFLNSFDVVMSDCDGVIWYLEKPISGAIDALRSLQDCGKRMFLVTNNSYSSVEHYCERLRLSGMEVKSEQVINTAKVITWYLKKIEFKDEAFVIASTSFRKTLTDAGIKVSPADLDVAEGDVRATIKALEDRPSIKAIIIDFCMFCDWSKLTFAISCLKRNDVLYLCGAQDQWIVYGLDKRFLGPGPLIEIITKHSGKTPIPCAKPSEVLKSYVLENCKVGDPKRCLFIGDTINYDMKFATMCGFQKLLVDTGLDNIKDAELNEETRPDYYIPSLGLLHPIIDSLRNDSVNGEK
ncbi:uncharacterized protein LOC100879185 isoform X1 [Megachile rotundata]|uniref:uncharacterized protein LOC100879185 isoform X1 n=2 Tax=Megachile rotundata TaxID=143995 RepID=UPI003FD46672